LNPVARAIVERWESGPRCDPVPGMEAVMRTLTRTHNQLCALAAFLLGQASLLWGIVVVTAYWLAFALLLPQQPHGGSAGLSLWSGPPLIGLLLGVMGLAAARSGEPVRAAQAWVGIALNLLAFLLVLVLRLLS